MIGLMRKCLVERTNTISEKQQTTDLVNINIFNQEETMRRFMIVILAVTLFLIPGISSAQMQGGGKGQGIMGQQMSQGGQGAGMMGPGMHANMTKMAELMNKMSQMMSVGKMTPEQQKQCGEILKQMSQVMHEMSATQNQQTTEMGHKQLQGMEKELDPLFYATHP